MGMSYASSGPPMATPMNISTEVPRLHDLDLGDASCAAGWRASCIDIDALIEATLESELLGGADDQRLEEGIASAEEYRRLLREAREQQRERFIVLLLKIAN